MRHRVRVSDLGKVRLGEIDPTRSALQGVAMILSTQQGTVPLYREFGLPMRYIDKPLMVGIPMMIAEVTEAIQDFAPNVELISVTHEMDREIPNKIYPIVEVELRE
jgi:phage baseplate assembly protein W